MTGMPDLASVFRLFEWVGAAFGAGPIARLAEEAAPGGGGAHGDGAHGAEHSAGLPQFDFATFPSQLFWLAVIFGLLYLVLSRALLPRVGTIIEVRDQRISGDLKSAAEANSAAQTASEELEAALAAARKSARDTLDQARAAAGEKASLAQAETETALAKRIAEAEAAIAKARENGLISARNAAAEAAGDLIERLGGARANPADLDAKAEAMMASLAAIAKGGRA